MLGGSSALNFMCVLLPLHLHRLRSTDCSASILQGLDSWLCRRLRQLERARQRGLGMERPSPVLQRRAFPFLSERASFTDASSFVERALHHSFRQHRRRQASIHRRFSRQQRIRSVDLLPVHFAAVHRFFRRCPRSQRRYRRGLLVGADGRSFVDYIEHRFIDAPRYFRLGHSTSKNPLQSPPLPSATDRALNSQSIRLSGSVATSSSSPTFALTAFSGRVPQVATVVKSLPASSSALLSATTPLPSLSSPSVFSPFPFLQSRH